jgi:hypothetical protein
MPSTSPAARQPAVDATIRIGVVLLTLTTATVHLSLLLPDTAFILNGLGYLALLAALYLPIPRLVPYRRAVRWALIGYAVLTLLLWVAIGERTPLGYPARLRDHGRGARLGRVIGTRRQEAASPR